jgi:hypothetical protein
MTEHIYAGDHETISITITDPQGNAIDLTGFNVTWGIAQSEWADPVVEKSTDGGGVELVDAANGKIEVTIVPGDTEELGGTYYQEVELSDIDSEITTAVPAELEIRATVLDA